MKYVAGEVIFRIGDESDIAYLIEMGKVEIYHDNDDGTRASLATLNAGHMFGEMGVLDNAPRSASARALTEVVLRAVDIECD